MDHGEGGPWRYKVWAREARSGVGVLGLVQGRRAPEGSAINDCHLPCEHSHDKTSETLKKNKRNYCEGSELIRLHLRHAIRTAMVHGKDMKSIIFVSATWK